MARRIGGVLVLLVLATSGFLFAGCGTLRAGRMVLNATGPANALAPCVRETELAVGAPGGRVPVRVYRPMGGDGALPAIVLVHGATAEGPHDPRFVALARAMAKRGATVATPDLLALRRFNLDPDDPIRVAATAYALANRSDLSANGRVALVGISVGGSYSLLSAKDPRLEGRVTSVLTFGAYADLDALVRRWMTDPKSETPGLLDPQTYGRRMVLLGNLEKIVPTEDVLPLRQYIELLLADVQPASPPPDLSASGLRVATVAHSEEAVAAEVVAELLRPLEADIRKLSPTRVDVARGATVHLLHGEGDPIVSVASLDTLAAHLSAGGADVTTCRTDLFDHVNKADEGRPSIFEAWPLFSFIADFLSDAGF